jgi:SecD/SecF fusion protein
VISGGRAQITGSFTDDEMTELALLIRAGALPVGLLEVQTSLVGPSLGIDSLQNSLVAGVIGVGLILILMLLMYRIMGLVANIGLALYILVVFWVLAILSAVLNLPGIAGLILSVGMAVDSNVIIFARIKEEYAEGKTLRVAVDTGFRRAMGTIIDSQLTTMIAGVVLYQFGTGPVRGFAMTLMIGIIVSVLTAVLVTQFLLKTAVETKSLAKPGMFGVTNKRMEMKRELSYLKHRKYFYIIAAVVIIIGVSSGVIRGFNWGIDFTGGTMIQIDMEQVVTLDEVQDVLRSHDLDASIVHAGDGNEEVIIRTTQALDTSQRQSVLADIYTAFSIDESNVLAVEQFSPSVGTLLKTNAIRAILIAAACMLVYIIIRFEWKFGLAAVAALIHDVLIMVAFYGLFQIPINNPFIAAVLIVVGYSINDTIVVFDRIRENRRIFKKNRIEDLIDKSINQTIVRSLMTSITTVVAIVPLLMLGGGSIREFVLPLMIGILAGAVSSITIASPVYYQLERLVNRPRYQGK